jgi:hypothetical protein
MYLATVKLGSGDSPVLGHCEGVCTPDTKSAERPRRSRRGWIGVGRAGLNAQEPNNTHAVPEPSMGEGTAWVEAPAFMPGRTSTCFGGVTRLPPDGGVGNEYQ